MSFCVSLLQRVCGDIIHQGASNVHEFHYDGLNRCHPQSAGVAACCPAAQLLQLPHFGPPRGHVRTPALTSRVRACIVDTFRGGLVWVSPHVPGMRVRSRGRCLANGAHASVLRRAAARTLSGALVHESCGANRLRGISISYIPKW